LPRRTLRIRVGGLVLAVEAERPTPALDPPPALVPFLAARGADLLLRYRAATPPTIRGERLFASEGVWEVERSRGRLVYRFRAKGRRPALYKQVTIDTALKHGTLHFDASPNGPHYALDYPLDELLFQHRLARDSGVQPLLDQLARAHLYMKRELFVHLSGDVDMPKP